MKIISKKINAILSIIMLTIIMLKNKVYADMIIPGIKSESNTTKDNLDSLNLKIITAIILSIMIILVFIIIIAFKEIKVIKEQKDKQENNINQNQEENKNAK